MNTIFHPKKYFMTFSEESDSSETTFDGKEIPLSTSPSKFHLRPDEGTFGSPMKRTPSWFEYKEVGRKRLKKEHFHSEFFTNSPNALILSIEVEFVKTTDVIFVKYMNDFQFKFLVPLYELPMPCKFFIWYPFFFSSENH